MHNNSENITSRWPEESKITMKWTDKTERATSFQRYNTSPVIAKIKSEKCPSKTDNACEAGKEREDSGQAENYLAETTNAEDRSPHP
jgi:hypothetical protein